MSLARALNAGVSFCLVSPVSPMAVHNHHGPLSVDHRNESGNYAQQSSCAKTTTEMLGSTRCWNSLAWPTKIINQLQGGGLHSAQPHREPSTGR